MTLVHLTPESFDLETLFKEAFALDCDDIQEDAHGVKRHAPESELEQGLPESSVSGYQCDDSPTSDVLKKPRSQNSRNHDRRRAARQSQKETGGRGVRGDVAMACASAQPIFSAEMNYVDLPVSSCGFHGKKAMKEEEKLDHELGGCTMEALLEAGATILDWDGVTPEVAVDKSTGTPLVILAGRPGDPTYVESATRAAIAILEAGERANFEPSEHHHRRADNSPALNVGVYYGGGGGKPKNLDNGKRASILQGLIANPDVSRMAAFADVAFKLWSPLVYEDVKKTLDKLYTHDPSLSKNWDANTYPCMAINFGPRVRSKTHKDFGNAPQRLCAVQAVGFYDHTKGGHLYIKELNLLIPFPHGSSILLPSALFTHSNTPVAHNEIRLSFTQFVPGGLLRYVHNGFRTEEEILRKSKREYREKMAEKEGRWKRETANICTLEQLKAYYSPKEGAVPHNRHSGGHATAKRRESESGEKVGA
ncbi:hypothetical protein FA13DRAFT_1665785 [Coprinellus micaceus]|uniref:Uncharacterized protein n=1 Tax=Coprinellus micaceus TaxID=71717 RepID=A0A4Y7T5C0_COPMI|nr:hypothetical protein FA13DRAFT_1665785 [Coprinellus micaceus]